MKACWCVFIRNTHGKVQAETGNLYVSFFIVAFFFKASGREKCREIRIKISIRCLHFREQIWAGLPKGASPARSWFPQGCANLSKTSKLEQNPKIKYADRDKLGKAELLAWLRGPQANLTEKLSFKHTVWLRGWAEQYEEHPCLS